MRVLMRVLVSADVLAAPGFEAAWQALLKDIGALASHPQEEGRVQQVLLDIEPKQITPIAEQVFRLAGAKPEFLPQITPPPYYGVGGA
jgi:hypothetical protein